MTSKRKESLYIFIWIVLTLFFMIGTIKTFLDFNDRTIRELANEKYKNATGRITLVNKYKEDYPINTDSIQHIDNNCIKVLDTQISSYRVFCGNFQIEYFNK